MTDYNPVGLSEIVGQPIPVRELQTFVLDPYPSRWLLEGRPGTGKTASTIALAHELGIHDFCCDVVSAADLNIGTCRELFDGRYTLRMPTQWGRWQLLVIEELERLPSATVVPYLKTRLSDQWFDVHYPNLIILATSNKSAGLDSAFLDRFRNLSYQAGQLFATACQLRMPVLWGRAYPGKHLPPGWLRWGWYTQGTDCCFSMRAALREMDLCGRRFVRMSQEAAV